MKGTRPLDNDEIRLVSACFFGAFSETETDAAQTTIVEGEDATDTTPERAPGEPTGEGDTDADADDRDVRAAGDEFGDS